LAKNASFGSLIAVALDPEAATPVYRQLYAQMRGAIISGRLATRMRLPSSRVLAAELGVSRNTVMTALDQLTTEGYLVGRVGDGTYVACCRRTGSCRAHRCRSATPPARAPIRRSRPVAGC
jgi:GntR family transcriptional regulator/MocR family aminotransferase